MANDHAAQPEIEFANMDEFNVEPNEKLDVMQQIDSELELGSSFKMSTFKIEKHWNLAIEI